MRRLDVDVPFVAAGVASDGDGDASRRVTWNGHCKDGFERSVVRWTRQ